jgi:uncharacterized protein YbcC (UPF0753/DUF2309 family)
MEVKLKAVTTKGKQYKLVSASKFEVVIRKNVQILEVYIYPLDRTKNARLYTRDLSELNYTEQQFTDEMEYLFDLLKNEALVQFVYDFLERTGFSLGMAFIAYSKQGQEREDYIKHLAETYVRDEKISTVYFGGKNE